MVFNIVGTIIDRKMTAHKSNVCLELDETGLSRGGCEAGKSGFGEKWRPKRNKGLRNKPQPLDISGAEGQI